MGATPPTSHTAGLGFFVSGSGQFMMLTPTFNYNNNFPNSINDINDEIVEVSHYQNNCPVFFLLVVYLGVDDTSDRYAIS